MTLANWDDSSVLLFVQSIEKSTFTDALFSGCLVPDDGRYRGRLACFEDFALDTPLTCR